MAIAALAVAASALLIVGCGGQGGADSYKIGALFAITGNNSPLGVPERDTALMLEEQINAKGGINGKPVKLVIYDTESDNTKAVTLAKKLIEQDKVLAIVGPTGSGEALAMVDTIDKAGVPWISCAAAIQVVQPVKKWAFMTPQSTPMAVGELFAALKKKGLTKVALITDSGSFGASGKQAMQDLTAGSGISIVAAESFDPKDTDMSAQLTKIKGSNPQVIIVWGTNPGPAIIAKNAKQLGITTPIYNSHGIANQEFIDLAGDAANGIIFPAGKLLVVNDIPASDPQKAVLTQYKKDFEAKYQKGANTFGGHAYDALTMIFKAIEKGGNDKAKVRDELEKTQNFPGTGGVFNMSPTDHGGLGAGSFAMVQIQNGKWTLYKD